MNRSPLCRLTTVTPFTVGGFASDAHAMIADSESHTIGKRLGRPLQAGVPLTLSDRPDTVTT